MSDEGSDHSMTSNRPYLLRAIYDWISDNDLTPYVLVDAGVEGVRVPPQAVKDGQIVLNLATQAVVDLDLGDDLVRFRARFGGVSQLVMFPVGAVLAIYAQENGQGMMFADDDHGGTTPPQAPPPSGADKPPSGKDKPSKRKTPHLRVIK